MEGNGVAGLDTSRSAVPAESTMMLGRDGGGSSLLAGDSVPGTARLAEEQSWTELLRNIPFDDTFTLLRYRRSRT